MDENKIIRVILEARDGLSGAIAKARKNIDKELGGMDKSFKDFSKGVKDFEKDVQSSFDGVEKSSKKVNSATKAVDGMTAALRNLSKEARAAKKDSNTFEGFGGTTLKKNKLGQFQKVSDSFNENFAKGFRGAVKARKNLDNLLQATEKIRKKNREILDDKFRELKVQRSIDQDLERASRIDVIHAKQQPFRDLRVQAAKEFNAAQERGDTEEAQRQQDIYEKLSDNLKSIEAQESAAITRKYQKIREEDQKVYNRAKAAIKNPDAINALKKFRAERDKILNSGTALDRAGKRAGFALGDFFSGISRGRSDIRTIDGDLEKLSGVFGRLGFAIGGAFKDLNKIVNLRWLFLTSAVTLFINVLTQLAAALVAVASSAIEAGAALGAAFAAGVAQALPVVGLLAGAFNELKKATAAIKLADKADQQTTNKEDLLKKRREATERLADAQYTLKKAIESVGEAQYQLNQSHKDVTKALRDQKTAARDLAEARIKASRDIVDANQQEKDSALALQEAELGILQAKEKLREEEEKNKRGAADVAGAQAAVKEAQDRLTQAKSQGDQAEVIKASQQLSIAKSNLDTIQDGIDKSKNDLKDAQLGVKRAELTREQAATKSKRDSQDAAKLRKQGVNDNKDVLQAQRQLADATQQVADSQHQIIISQRGLAEAVHAVAQARREESDAKKDITDKTNLQTTAQKNLNEAIANFSPAEKKLYLSLKRVQDAYKKAFVGGKGKNGILAPILNGFSGIADAILKLLTDPKILKALSGLAKEIGKGIQRFASILSSKGFKDDVLFFIEEATKNLPKVFNIFLNIFDIVRKIARAGSPIFDDLLGGLDKLTSKADKFVNSRGKRPEEGTRGLTGKASPTNLESFLTKAETHLKAWLDLGKAIARVLQLLITNSAPTGKTLVEDLTDSLNKLGDFIQKNPEKVQKFFEDLRKNLTELASAFKDLAIALGRVAQDKDIQELGIFFLKTIVPGLLLMIKAVGVLSKVLNTLTKIPILGKFVQFGLEVLIAEKALNKLFPVTQGVTNLIRKGFAESFKTLGRVILNPKKGIEQLNYQLLTLKSRTEVLAEKSIKKLKEMGNAWLDFGKKMGDSVKKGASSAATGLSNLSTKLLQSAKNSKIVAGLSVAFTALVDGIKAVGLALKSVFFTPPFILLLIAAIITAIILLDRKFHFIRPTIEFFEKQFKRIFAWIKDHWKLLAVIIASPFLFVAAPIIALIKFRGKILNILSDIKNGFIDAFTAVKNFIVGIVKAISKEIGKIWDKVPGPVKTLLKIAVDPVGAAADLGKGAVKAGKKVLGKVFGFAGGTSGVGGTDTVPAMLTPGEWVLNSKQQRKLANAMGVTVQQARAQIFGTKLPPGGGWNHGGVGRKGKSSGSKAPLHYGTFTLIPEETDSTDAFGNKVTAWFIQMADGTFGQVTQRDADKIQKSGGSYIPGYVKRNSHGFKQMLNSPYNNIGSVSFMNGGIAPRSIRGFAEGGVVQSPGYSGGSDSPTINQNFNVKTEGATDWSYVMRLSAITAQSSF